MRKRENSVKFIFKNKDFNNNSIFIKVLLYYFIFYNGFNTNETN